MSYLIEKVYAMSDRLLRYRVAMSLVLLIFSLGGNAEIILTPRNLINGHVCVLKRGVSYAYEEHNAYIKSFVVHVVMGELKVRERDRNKSTLLLLVDKSLQKVEYCLCVGRNKIKSFATDEAGWIYGLHSLIQLRVDSSIRCISFVCGKVEDSPRMAISNFMLDSGRQCQMLNQLKQILDLLCVLCFNYFHWLLSEGLGWRIEVPEYPKLTSIGAYVVHGPEQQGFYITDDIRNIVRYASDRNITIIPKIDIPSHGEATLKAYPQYSCFGRDIKIPESKGFTDQIICAVKGCAICLLKEVLDEVCDLFPSPYIHIGVDEALKGEFQLLKNIVIDRWNGRGHGLTVPKRVKDWGLKVICGTNLYTYLNILVQSWKGYCMGRTFNLRTCYKNNIFYLYSYVSRAIGMNCALWTDYGLTFDMLSHRMFPRILAIVEQMWIVGDLMPYPDFLRFVDDRESY